VSRARLLADLKAATTDLAAARRTLADEQFRARHGMAHNLIFAAHVEHTTYHRWLRIGEALANYR
jgi:hypothetical protein